MKTLYKKTPRKIRTRKSKEKQADFLLYSSNSLFFIAMTWIVTPYLSRFHKGLEHPELYSQLDFFGQLRFFFVYDLLSNGLMYFIWIFGFVVLISLGGCSREQAFDIYDSIEDNKNRIRR